MTFFPWKSRKPVPLVVRRRFKDAKGRVYEEMSDGSTRRPHHDRHDRRLLGLSPRRYRRLKKALERAEKAGDRDEMERLAKRFSLPAPIEE